MVTRLSRGRPSGGSIAEDRFRIYRVIFLDCPYCLDSVGQGVVERVGSVGTGASYSYSRETSTRSYVDGTAQLARESNGIGARTGARHKKRNAIV
jgi:hypothetical protein